MGSYSDPALTLPGAVGQTELSADSKKNVANGVAGLDVSGKLNSGVLSESLITNLVSMKDFAQLDMIAGTDINIGESLAEKQTGWVSAWISVKQFVIASSKFDLIRGIRVVFDGKNAGSNDHIKCRVLHNDVVRETYSIYPGNSNWHNGLILDITPEGSEFAVDDVLTIQIGMQEIGTTITNIRNVYLKGNADFTVYGSAVATGSDL